MDRRQDKFSPRVGPHESEGIPPSNIDAAPWNTGGANSVLNLEATNEVIANPFSRKDSIKRTPPRKSSLPDLRGWADLSEGGTMDRVYDEKSAGKRKRLEGSPCAEERKEWKTLIGKLLQSSKTLNIRVKENVNTKVEIKKAVRELSEIATQMQERWKYLEDALSDKRISTPSETPLLLKETRDVETQTTQDPNEERNDPQEIGFLIRQRIETAQSPEEIFGTIKLEWPESTYRTKSLAETDARPLVHKGNAAIVVQGDKMKENNVVKVMKGLIPLLERAIQGGIVEGQIMCASVTNKLEMDGESEVDDMERHLYLVGAGAEYNTIEEWKRMCRSMEQLIKRATGKGDTSLTVFAEKGKEIICRKALEWALKGSNLDITVIMAPSNQWQTWGIKKKKTDILIIKPEKREDESNSYANVLKHLKKNLNAEDYGATIKDTQRTKEGGIKMFVHSKNGTDKLKSAIETTLGKTMKANVYKTVKRKAIIISELDETTSREEIKGALEENGIRVDDPEMGEVRRSRRGNLTCTIFISPEEGFRLIKMKRIKVGWRRCRVIEKITPLKCMLCNKIGHIAKDCREDKEYLRNRCLNCLTPGHIAKECTNQPKCYNCDIEGHRAESMVCPKYREWVKEAKNNRGGKSAERPKNDGTETNRKEN